MKLPTLIRHDVYKKYLDRSMLIGTGLLIHMSKTQDCACIAHEPSWYTRNRCQVSIPLARASKHVRDELLPIVYSR